MQWVFILLLCATISQAPSALAENLASGDTLVVPQDSAAGAEGIAPDLRLIPINSDTASPGYTPSKSPALALVMSALVPGSGQFYNESYWKVPVVVGFGVYFGSRWLDNHRKFTDFRDQYKESLLNSPTGNPTLLRLRDFYRSQRDTFTWYLAIWYFVTALDAYVDASLYDFDVEESLSLQVVPGIGRISMRMNF